MINPKRRESEMFAFNAKKAPFLSKVINISAFPKIFGFSAGAGTKIGIRFERNYLYICRDNHYGHLQNK